MTGGPALPGTIPGLLRRGSPVVATSARERGTYLGLSEHGETYGGDPLHHVALHDTTGPAPWVSDAAPLVALALDLTDATGRAHAAWWLAAKLWPDDGPYIAAAVVPGRTIGPLRMGISTVSTQEGDRWRGMPDAAEDAIADLDPRDPRLLPDGSRWVDAEALRRVVLHVAGVTP